LTRQEFDPVKQDVPALPERGFEQVITECGGMCEERQFGVWQGARDSDDRPCRWINRYHCEACGVSWEDQWSCACNDKCPLCNTEIEPHESVERDLQDHPADNERPAA
jgi:hypothetical protein